MLLSEVFFLLFYKSLLLLLLVKSLLSLLVLEHHDVELLNVMIRVLSKVLVYEGLMKALLFITVPVPKEANAPEDPKVTYHLWIVKSHVIL